MDAEINSSAYDVAGPAGARPIVFLHGMRLTRRMWQPQMEALADSFRVIALDLPGHGALKGQHFRLESAGEQIARLIDCEAEGRAIVAGLSLGGYIAMDFGARYPEKAAGLVISGATVEPCGAIVAPYRLLAQVMERAPESWLAALNRLVYRWMYPGERGEPLIAPGFYMRGGAEALREVLGKEFIPRLRSYRGPVLMLNGVRDFAFRRGEKDFLAAARNGRLVILEGAFHISNIDQPEAFSSAIRQFAELVSESR